MAYIESHQELERHPKLLDLALKAKTDKYGAVGRIHCLWWWCLSYAIDGDLQKFPRETIELACSIPLDVLLECNFVDEKPYLRIHDWWDYAGRYIKIKFKNYPQKWKRIARLYLGSPKGPLKPTPRRLSYLSKLSNQSIPYAEFPKWWEEHRGRLPAIKEFSEDRKVAFANLWEKKPDPAYWQDVIKRLAASDFACGGGKDGWKATVDFLLRKNSHIKIMEGQYDNRDKKVGSPSWM